MMNRGLVLLTMTLGFVLLPSQAKATIFNNPQSHINVDRALGKAESAYERKARTLPDGERQKLAALDRSLMLANRPQLELAEKSVELAACAKLDPTLQVAYGKKIQNFTMTKLDEMREGWALLDSDKKKIYFMGQGLVDGHVAYVRNVESQSIASISAIMAQRIVSGKDKTKCGELKADLDSNFAQNYTVPARQRPLKVTIVRGQDGHTVQACVTGINHRMGNGTYIDVALVYARRPKESQPTLILSAKIQSPDHQYMKIRDMWVNFGSIDTRFSSQTTRQTPELLVGKMQSADLILPMLDYMKHHKIVAAVKAEGWEKQVAFEAGLFPAAVLAKMAACVAAVDPALAGPLRMDGFALSPKVIQ